MAWNRFAYVYNNPVNNVDPSGHFVLFAIDTAWDVIDLYNDASDCLGDSDSMACYMAAAGVAFVAMGALEGPSNNVARRAAKAADVGDAASDVARRVDDVSKWTEVGTPWGRTVYQRSDIDWDFLRPEGTKMAGITNLEAAELGYAPVRLNPKTGKIDTLVLHHMNKEPGGALIEVWSSTHNKRHAVDRLAGRGLTGTYDPLLGWRKTNPQWDNWFRTEQSVYWRWYKGGYNPPLGAVNMPPGINPRLP